MPLFKRRSSDRPNLSAPSSAENAAGLEEFTCPYCFRKVRHDEVCFLVPFSEEDLGGSILDTLSEEDQERIRQEQALKQLFQKRTEDPILESFWKNVGGAAAYTSNPIFSENLQWNSPLVTPQNADEMTDSGYETDKDGFVCSVHDRLTHRESRARLCPHCHNVLPEEYGKYPASFIAIVGITSAGKTLYLTQLLGDIQQYLINVGVTVLFRDKEAQRFRRIADEEDILPNATAKNDLRPPITVTLMDQSLKKFFTLVFYDIAGENCVDPERMKNYGPYIEHADGIIMLLDPVQFPQLGAMIRADNPNAVGMAKDTASVYQVLEAMYQNFLIHRMDAQNRVTVPFAFTVSKSDYLDPILSLDPSLQNSLIMKAQVPTKRSNRFGRLVADYAQLVQINRDTWRMIENMGDPGLCEMVKNNFAKRQFFSVSALGSGTRWVLSHTGALSGEYDNSFWSDEGNPSRIVISLDGTGLKSRDALNTLLRQRGSTILCYDLRTRELERTESAPDWLNRELFYIEVNGYDRAIYELFYSARDNAPMRGAKMEFFMTPCQHPAPRRVEEPLYWLMMEMGLLPKDDRG